MFTHLKLTNFRSFEHIEMNLTGRKRSPKQFAMIFGENGAGKSNLVHAFQLLIDLLQTMDVRDIYEQILNQESIFSDEKMEQRVRQHMLSGLRDMRAIIEDCRMIGCDDPICIEFGFQIDDSRGTYTVELGSSEIIHEKLEFLLNKRRGAYFECSPTKLMINPAIFLDKSFLADIRNSCKRFWGKHSFLSILLYELRDKSNNYGWKNLSANFQAVIASFCTLSFHSHLSTEYVHHVNDDLRLYPLRDAVEGSIPFELEDHLDRMAGIITLFFNAINSHILRAYYQKEFAGKKIKYQLYFEKNIAGKKRDIPFKKESTGNLQLLKVLCAALPACAGETVIIDEADAGIHDVLFQKLIEDLSGSIRGQLILTSHNTMLLETNNARETVYIISENADTTEIKCIADYENRTFLNNNIRNKYLNNDYNGIPSVSPIDFARLTAAAQELAK